MKSLLLQGQRILENVQLILFDKDGTLIDLDYYWGQMVQRRAMHITEKVDCGMERESWINQLAEAMGFDSSKQCMKPEGPIGVKPRAFIVHVAAETLRQGGIAMDDAEMEVLFQEVDRATVHDLKPLLKTPPGVMEFLNQGKSHGIQFAIVTSDISTRARATVQALGIEDHFPYIAGSDLVTQGKPAGDLAQWVLSASGCDPQYAAVIGDHPVDVQMGLNSNIACNIGVLTGIGSKEQFETLPCHIIEDMNDLALNH